MGEKEMTMEKSKKILVTRNFPENGLNLLEEQGFELLQWDQERPMTQSELIHRAKECHGMLCTLTDLIDDHFLNQCRHLEVISQYAVGYDNIDIHGATHAGIPIGFTPDAMSEATADIAFGLMIATSRKMFYLHKSILKGEWGFFRPKGHLGMELKNRTLGIFGLGRIGMKMAQRCKGAYGMDILYCSRTRSWEAEKELSARFVSFDELLKNSDILSVHSVLNDDTRGVFDKQAFEKMKKSAIFINTARGPVHNEPDLLHALETGEIRGAGLDVTDPEPMDKNNPMLTMENVSVLPHIGSGTQEARNEMSMLAARNIIAFYQTGKMPHCVNPEVLG